MALTAARLRAITTTLSQRPGHENVAHHIQNLVVNELGATDHEFGREVRLPAVRGRMDALFGATVFEFKRDLSRERANAEEQLQRYIQEKQRIDKRRYLGIATDGADFIAYEVTGGNLREIGSHRTKPDDPRALVRWLDTAITVRGDLAPTPQAIREEFGRDSLAHHRAMEALKEAWDEAQHIPEAALKKDLWHQHLEFVYGTLVDADELFLQHTYLVIIAKSIAHEVLGLSQPDSRALLDGSEFTKVGLHGAVETDFFDWVLLTETGDDLASRINRQIARFRLRETENDVLKSIYESLIDPAQRHALGEYYTPDWLAAWVHEEAIPEPLTTKVLDPACGSGTFLFHGVRRVLDAAEQQGMSLQNALALCTERVIGLDVHPVAVLFARVTYLLAIGPERLRKRNDELFVPVYLGDALQWNVRQFVGEEEVEISVPDSPPLLFPGTIAAEPGLLERLLKVMNEHAHAGAPQKPVRNWLNTNAQQIPSHDQRILLETYDKLRTLHAAGRDHVWTFVVRNLTRPLWLSRQDGRADVVIGNPPWLRFSAMSETLKAHFRKRCQAIDLWVGGKMAPHQDLGAYFFARAADRYLETDGRLAMVMPMAALSREQYRKFRSGRFREKSGEGATVIFDSAWMFDHEVSPLFPVPACVLFAHRTAVPKKLPEQVTAFTGTLPDRDANSTQAANSLSHAAIPWPTANGGGAGSPYRDAFRQGATFVPRRLLFVTMADQGPLGGNPNMPVVRARVGAQDKAPWKDIEPIEGPIERQFVWKVATGEALLPHRLAEPSFAVLPIETKPFAMMDSAMALREGHLNLSRRLGWMEEQWEKLKKRDLTLNERLDFYGGLHQQFPIDPIRVAYATSGTVACAAIIRDTDVVSDTKIYWASCETISEANCICAILNSKTTTTRASKMQSEGQFGKRDFHKVIFNLNIPRFDPSNPLHADIAAAGARAEAVAAGVKIDTDRRFQTNRKIIREAIAADPVGPEIERLVTRLLDGG